MNIVREALEFYVSHLKKQFFHANAEYDSKRASEIEEKIKEIELILSL